MMSAIGAAANRSNEGKFIQDTRVATRLRRAGSHIAQRRGYRRKIYQLDLVTPGIKPCEASSRKVRRDILKRRIKARRRPVTSHRFTTRVGLASRGNCVSPA